MIYKKHKNLIEIKSNEEFNVQKTLDCGQVFRFFKDDNAFFVISTDKVAKIIAEEDKILIKTLDVDYFENYFDLKTDYSKINAQIISENEFLKNAIKFGCGIRILKQNKFETLVSFIVSANNNISRIKKSLNLISEKFGKKLDCNFYTFPTLQELSSATEADFVACGLGYRAGQLVKTIQQLNAGFDLNGLTQLNSEMAERELVKLSGVGPKVADCVLQFGYGRQDVFIVDTWIEKAYFSLTGNNEKNRLKIKKELVKAFKDLSGYVQQYLFYFKRSIK